MAFFGIRNYLLVARWYGNPIQMAAAVGMVVGVRIPRILFRAVISKDIRYLRGLNWFLLWFLDPNLVPPDFRIAQALAGPGKRGPM